MRLPTLPIVLRLAAHACAQAPLASRGCDSPDDGFHDSRLAIVRISLVGQRNAASFLQLIVLREFRHRCHDERETAGFLVSETRV